MPARWRGRRLDQGPMAITFEPSEFDHRRLANKSTATPLQGSQQASVDRLIGQIEHGNAENAESNCVHLLFDQRRHRFRISARVNDDAETILVPMWAVRQRVGQPVHHHVGNAVEPDGGYGPVTNRDFERIGRLNGFPNDLFISPVEVHQCAPP
jgi:hypothetical protein